MVTPRVKVFDLPILCIVLVAVAAGLIFVMAGASRFNSHPDEADHLKAVRYYISYWLPPAIGDARSEGAYSTSFGISYLDEPDIVYLLAGKFAASLRFTGLPTFLLARAVNFLLFVVLFLLLLKISLETGVPFYGILLLSPQIWYVFSYFNGDAFGFFVGSCLVLELSRFIRDPERTTPSLRIGFWLGMLTLSKRNYFALIPVVVGVVLWHWIFLSKVGQRRVLAKGWLKVVLVAMLVALPRIGYQQWVNGFDLSGKRIMQMEMKAAPGFKPSQVTAPYSPWYVNMRAKGRPFQELFLRYRWHSMSFKSMVGVYGWMDIFSPNWYYWVIFSLYAILFARLCFLSRPFELPEPILTALGILGMAAVGVASLLNSWTVAFQAQGRYLFPAICIFFLLLACKWERLPKKFFYSVFLSTGLLSLGNFIFVGLGNIPK
jgi:hypothetical protein